MGFRHKKRWRYFWYHVYNDTVKCYLFSTLYMMFDSRIFRILLFLSLKKRVFDRWLLSKNGRTTAFIVVVFLIVLLFKAFLNSMY